jgi:hypothetical protein
MQVGPRVEYDDGRSSNNARVKIYERCVAGVACAHLEDLARTLSHRCAG